MRQVIRVNISEKRISPIPVQPPESSAVSSAEVAEDLRLLKQIAAGDQQAMADLYQRRATLLYSLLLRMLSDPMEAQETFQDTFVRIWRRAGSFDPGRSAPLAWMILLARGLAVDRLRARSRRRANLAALDGELASLELEPASDARELERDELSSVCQEALYRLPEAQAHALQLAFLRGWTHEEIARAQNEPLGTIKARIRRGLQALRQALKDYRDA